MKLSQNVSICAIESPSFYLTPAVEVYFYPGMLIILSFSWLSMSLIFVFYLCPRSYLYDEE